MAPGKGPGSKVSGARALLATGRVLELPDHFRPRHSARCSRSTAVNRSKPSLDQAAPRSSTIRPLRRDKMEVSSTGDPIMEIEFAVDTPTKKTKSCRPGSRLQISVWTVIKLVLVLSCSVWAAGLARSCGCGRARGSPAVAMHL